MSYLVFFYFTIVVMCLNNKTIFKINNIPHQSLGYNTPGNDARKSSLTLKLFCLNVGGTLYKTESIVI